jgi:transposase InsO family protein
MVVAVAATVFLALFGRPYDNAAIEWFYSSNWTLLRAPLLLGTTSAFVLLAVTFQHIFKNNHPDGHGFPDEGFN